MKAAREIVRLMGFSDFNLRQDDIIGIIVIIIIFNIFWYFYKNMGVWVDTRSEFGLVRSWQGPFFLGGR